MHSQNVTWNPDMWLSQIVYIEEDAKRKGKKKNRKERKERKGRKEERKERERERETQTHTHTQIYIYIYVYIFTYLSIYTYRRTSDSWKVGEHVQLKVLVIVSIMKSNAHPRCRSDSLPLCRPRLITPGVDGGGPTTVRPSPHTAGPLGFWFLEPTHL